MKHLDNRLKKYGAVAAGIAAATIPAHAQDEVEVDEIFNGNYYDLNGDGQNDVRTYGYNSSWSYTQQEGNMKHYIDYKSCYASLYAPSNNDYTVNFMSGYEGTSNTYFFLQPGDTIGPKGTFGTNSWNSIFYGEYKDTTRSEPVGMVVIREPIGIAEELQAMRVAAQDTLQKWTTRNGAFSADLIGTELYVGVRMTKKEQNENPGGGIKLPLRSTAVSVDSIYYGWLKFKVDFFEEEQQVEEPIGDDKVLVKARVAAKKSYPQAKLISYYMNDVVNEPVRIASTTNAVSAVGTSIVLDVYPNPASDLITIASDEQIESLQVVNTLGEIVISNITDEQVDVSGLTAGTYFVYVVTENGKALQAFIKE